MPFVKCSDCDFAQTHEDKHFYCHKSRTDQPKLSGDGGMVGGVHLVDWKGCGEGESKTATREQWRDVKEVPLPTDDSYRAWVVTSTNEGWSNGFEVHSMRTKQGVQHYWVSGPERAWEKFPSNWTIVAWRPYAVCKRVGDTQHGV